VPLRSGGAGFASGGAGRYAPSGGVAALRGVASLKGEEEERAWESGYRLFSFLSNFLNFLNFRGIRKNRKFAVLPSRAPLAVSLRLGHCWPGAGNGESGENRLIADSR
jgi:hypothetical protein